MSGMTTQSETRLRSVDLGHFFVPSRHLMPVTPYMPGFKSGIQPPAFRSEPDHPVKPGNDRRDTPARARPPA